MQPNAAATPDALILLIACPDRRGIVAAVTRFLSRHGGNVLELEQHTDAAEGAFFMRAEVDRAGFGLSRREFPAVFGPVARRLRMSWSLHARSDRARVALFVTREPHCLFDLLARHAAGEWNADIPAIVANQPDLEPVAQRFGIPFHLFPITKENKAGQERSEVRLLRRLRVDTVVLARYMQIVTGDFLAAFPNRVINIHHSFLPSFMGARPYHAAHERGVKIIGATSHYVTEELDHGPIIEQDVIRVSHREAVEDFIRKGKDVEKVVLARAVAAHLEHRVVVYRNRTVVFS